MLTKELIVQRLLDEKLINVEEAVILLKTEVTKWLPTPGTTSPWIGPGPSTPYQPYRAPWTPINPMFPHCDWTVRPEHLPYYGDTSHSHNTNENFCTK